MRHEALSLVGVNHFDPLQRSELLDCLQNLAQIHNGAPAFVAVEYDDGTFRQILRQRPTFRVLLAAEWPDLTVEELDTLQASLGYEGDTPHAAFPGVRLLWLDEGRPLPHVSEGDGYARRRIATYRHHLKGTSLHQRIGFLSERLRAVADDEMCLKRDRKFASRLHTEMIALGDGWGLAIVGASHADCAIVGSMAALLNAGGVAFTVRRLA